MNLNLKSSEDFVEQEKLRGKKKSNKTNEDMYDSDDMSNDSHDIKSKNGILVN